MNLDYRERNDAPLKLRVINKFSCVLSILISISLNSGQKMWSVLQTIIIIEIGTNDLKFQN
jgi:hypothetical protein